MGVSIADPFLRNSLYVNLDTRFQAGVVAAPSWASKVSLEVPSTSRATRHAWLTKLAGRLKKYTGEKQVEKLATRSYLVENDKYAEHIEIPEEDIEDDQIGMYGNLAQLLGSQAGKWPDDMLVDAIQGGTANLCYDGQPFFNGSHPVNLESSGAGTFSNLKTGRPLTATNFATTWQDFMSLKMEDGRPLPIMPKAIMVDPSNAIQARQILNTQVIGVSVGSAAASQTNVLQGMLEPIVIPEFGNQPGVWYMLAELGGVQPFFHQIRKKPVTTQLTDPQSGNVFWHDKFIWGVKARGAAGYTFPFLAMRIEPT